MQFDAVIIGGGASGLMCAVAAKLKNSKLNIAIIEKNDRVGKKLLSTGNGRCNLTNNCDNQTFINNVPVNGRFLYSAINNFSTADVMDFFEGLGLELKTERGNRVFPVSDKAVDVVDAMRRFAFDSGVKIVNDTAVKLLTENGEAVGVECQNETYYADSVIICCGGKSCG